MEYTHKGLRPDHPLSRWLSIMDKVCTLMATCLETCILWPHGDLRFFRRPVCGEEDGGGSSADLGSKAGDDTSKFTRKHV